jgi:hypothetical protein
MKRSAALAAAVLLAAKCLSAYSVLTHEAVIDAVWKDHVEPALRARFTSAPADAVRHARAYAYGGCILQDMGYYPFGSRFFSDLTHYVRTGDFVSALLAEARTVEEYAFALGALAHYAADTEGHSHAVNPAVAIVYPHLAKRYGASVTYEENPRAHVKTEFGFDVLQVARGRYAPDAYHDFIGFEVARDLLDRAFLSTYSLRLDDVFPSVDLALGSYRWAVRSLIPQAAKVAWELNKDDLKRDRPGLTRRAFIYNLSRAGYEREWGRQHRGPGLGARILAVFVRLIPKVGPLDALAFHAPTPRTADLFMESFNRTVAGYERWLADARSGRLRLDNRNLDTGGAAAPGEYGLTDATYGLLARRLADGDASRVSSELRAHIVWFYANPDALGRARRKGKEWRRTQAALRTLAHAAR